MSKMEMSEATYATVRDTTNKPEDCAPHPGLALWGGGKVEIPGSKDDAEKLMQDKILPHIMLDAKEAMDKATTTPTAVHMGSFSTKEITRPHTP